MRPHATFTIADSYYLLLFCWVVCQWRREDGERSALAMDASKVTQNVSVDLITGDEQQLRRRHRYYQPHQQRQQQLQQAGRYYYTSTLTLRSTVTRDSGAYVCSATNNHGFVERRTFLHVIPAGKPPPELLYSPGFSSTNGATAGF